MAEEGALRVATRSAPSPVSVIPDWMMRGLVLAAAHTHGYQHLETRLHTGFANLKLGRIDPVYTAGS